MKRENGLALTALLILVVLLMVGSILAITSFVSAYNTGNQFEQSIRAEYENNENILSQYSQKVMEVSQVPDMMRDDVVKVTREAIQGRYGQEGLKAAFVMVTEQNPQLSEGLYLKIQQVVEAGRDEFKNAQTRLIDKKRAYQTALGSFWQGFWLRMAGYPKTDLDKYKVITNDVAAKAFNDGKESGPMKLRQP